MLLGVNEWKPCMGAGFLFLCPGRPKGEFFGRWTRGKRGKFTERVWIAANGTILFTMKKTENTDNWKSGGDPDKGNTDK